MEILSEMSERVRYPLEIPVPSYLRDHRIMDQEVLPAAQALCLLADSVQDQTGMAGLLSCDAKFERFLHLPQGADHVPGYVELRKEQDGSVSASLQTRVTAKRGGITRIKDHVSVRFSLLRHEPPLPPDMSRTPSGPAFELDKKDLYEQIVPLGPAYQNCIGSLHLTPDGVSAEIASPSGYLSQGVLGSHFVFDAALHAANAWGQRFAGVTAFPVGYSSRFVLSATREGKEYLCRVVPLSSGTTSDLDFDIWLLDRLGEIQEVILGVRMRDLFAGRIRPPQWVLV